jgi:uncharacterized protein (DUF1501 family)
VLDPDISTSDALRLLSRIEPSDGLDEPSGPRGWSRRTFLQAVGAGVFGGAAVGTIAGEFFGGDIPEAWAGTPVGANEGITIVVTLYGGSDGLNIFVPYGDGNYYSSRANIAIPQEQILPVNGSVGFAPQLTYLKTLYDAGQVAAIQGVGYANPNLSHFTSMAIWMNGRFGSGPASSGWVGRWLDGQPSASADLAAVSLDSSVPLHMQGVVRRAAGIPPRGGMFGTSTSSSDQRMYSGLRAMSSAASGRGALHDTFTQTMRRQLDLADDVAPAFSAPLPGGGELTRELTIAARLINANLGMRVIDVSRGGFDNHDNQPNSLPGLLVDLNAGLQAFYATLQPAWQNRVTILVVSEFGRTPRSNDSRGTDHGTSNTTFVIGSNVRGGLYGQMPSLVNLDRNGRMLAHVDFRWVYGSLLDGWMGGGGTSILNGAYQNLGLFRAAPGRPSSTTTPVVLGPSVASGFVSSVPRRVFDTRDGTGGRTTPLQAGESWAFQLAGRFDIPADATAVALNLTAVDATAPSYVSVWPGGTVKPFTANLNPVPGMAVPNLVVGQLGPAGSLSFYNNTGSVHLVADVVGHFTPSSRVRLQALTPARLLDTRDGTGGRLGAVAGGSTIDVKVTDRAGVPAGATAVALNVTVTEPTAGSFLTVYPTGQTRPLASSVNMVPGQTVPNMVLATVGADGKVSIYNNSGSTHVVADVVAAFANNAPGRLVALSPARVLDTREGIGAPLEKVRQEPLILKLTGVAGIPGSGVSAVLMNVAAVIPDADTFITVAPAGAPRPLASNLNVVAGQVIPNMVLARVGADGSVAIYNNSGSVDLVADVMGYFTG